MMQANQVRDWLKAIELLDQLLNLPAEQRRQAARRLGAEHQVAAQLGCLLTSLSRPSVLDDSLAPVLLALAGREAENGELSRFRSDAGIRRARGGDRRAPPGSAS